MQPCFELKFLQRPLCSAASLAWGCQSQHKINKDDIIFAPCNAQRPRISLLPRSAGGAGAYIPCCSGDILTWFLASWNACQNIESRQKRQKYKSLFDCCILSPSLVVVSFCVSVRKETRKEGPVGSTVSRHSPQSGSWCCFVIALQTHYYIWKGDSQALCLKGFDPTCVHVLT